MSDPGKAVFLSYASQDAEAAKKICDALRAAGVEVWFDQSELVGGDQWDTKIRKQIGSCALFIPIISAGTQARAEGYFRLEWRLADKRTELMGKSKAFLLPVCIDDTRDSAADVPDSFMAVQWTRLRLAYGGQAQLEGVDPALAVFVARVRKLLDGSDVGASLADARGRTQGAPLQSKTSPTKWWWVLPIFGVAMALLLVLKEGRKDPAPATPTQAAAQVSEARKLADKARALFENPNYTPEDLTLAGELFERATKLDPVDAEIWAAWSQLSSEYFGGGTDRSDARLEAARNQAQRALKLAPESTEAAYAMASYLRRLGGNSLGEAERMYRQLAERTPGDVRIFISLGKVAQEGARFGPVADRERRAAEAIAWLDQAEAMPGGRAEALRQKAWVYYFQNRMEEAWPWAEEAQALQPTNSGYRLKLSLATALGRLDEAVATLAKLPPEYLRTDTGATQASLIWRMKREPGPALAALRPITHDYISTNGFSGPTGLLTGLAYELAGHREMAEMEWRTALTVVERRLESRPSDFQSLYDRAYLQALLGKREEAERGLAFLRQMTGGKGAALTMDTILIVLRLGQHEEAIAYLQARLAEKRQSEYVVNRVRLLPEFDVIRDDPRVQAMLAERVRPAKSPGPNPGASTPPPVDSKSVAVLAFANYSDDKANEYFSDGISEELLNVLAKVPGLKVTARTSSFFFKGKDTPIPEIAKQLGVAYVIEGSVRKAGDKVRITAQLIKAADGFHVWSDTFTRDLKDIFAVQDEIAALIAKNLELKMGMTTGPAREINPEAYQEYLAGRAWVAKAGMADLKEAVRHFERAVAVEPTFTAAWVQLASAHTQLGRWGGAPTLQAWPAARTAIDHALALEPDSPDVLLALGWIQRTADWNWRGAEQTYRRALALRPNHPDTLSAAAVLLFNIGQKEEALRLGRQAVQLDPLNPATQLDLSLIFYFSEEWVEQEKLARRAIQLAPAGVSYQVMLAYSLAGQRRFAEAEAVARLEADDVGRLSALGMFAVQQGQAEAARGYRRQLEELYLVRGDTADLQLGIADISAGLGEKDRAFAALEIIRTARDSSVAWLRNDYYLRPLYSDPRWPAFLRKVGLADDQLK